MWLCTWIGSRNSVTPFQLGGSLAPPEQDRLEHGPHSCKLPMFAEDVNRVALAIFQMELDVFGCNCFPDSMIGCQMVSFGDGGVGDGRAGNN